jgi:hypothetical protein
MKVALCLSGQPRYIDHIVPLIKNFLMKDNGPDVFFHTWFDKNDVDKLYGSSIPSQDGKLGSAHPDTIQIFEDSFLPKKRIFEPQREFEVVSRLRTVQTAVSSHLVSMFYSIEQADKLRREYEYENNFKYDVVVRSRFDLYFNQHIDFSNFLETSNAGKIISPKKWQESRMNFIPGLGDYTMNGDFVAGNSDVIERFSNIYSNIEFINEKINPPYAENYFGFKTRVMEGIEVVPYPLDVEILYRVLSNTANLYYP